MGKSKYFNFWFEEKCYKVKEEHYNLFNDLLDEYIAFKKQFKHRRKMIRWYLKQLSKEVK